MRVQDKSTVTYMDYRNVEWIKRIEL